jgi:hypothetical protein
LSNVSHFSEVVEEDHVGASSTDSEQEDRVERAVGDPVRAKETAGKSDGQDGTEGSQGVGGVGSHHEGHEGNILEEVDSGLVEEIAAESHQSDAKRSGKVSSTGLSS